MKRIIFFLILVVFLITFHFLGILTPVEKSIISAAIPIGDIFHGFFGFFGDTYQKYLSRKDFEEENKRLIERTRDLTTEKAELNLLREENASLKKMLSFFEGTDYKNVTARIIGKTTEGERNAIIINKGAEDGMVENLPIIAEGGVLIGKIIKVSLNISTVLLLSDGGSQVAGMIQNKNQTIGIIKGGYGLGTRMEFIPQTEVIKSDEIVITSGVEIEIPKGLLVGAVESVIKEEYTPFQTVTIKPLLDYEKLDFVSALIVK